MTKHTLTLTGGSQHELRIPAATLIEVVASLIEGARLATRFAVEGASVRKGPRPAWLDAACAVDVTGLSAGSTIIAIEAPLLRDADAERFGQEGQRSLFDNADQDLGGQTAVDLFGSVLSSIIDGAEEVVADRALLEVCARFANVSQDGLSSIRLDGLQTRQRPLIVKPEHVGRIESLRDETPSPQAVRVAGILDTISATRPDVVLRLKDGTKVLARLEDHEPDALRQLFSRKVFVSGIAHYRPSGEILSVNVEAIGEAGPGDRLFESTPTPRSRPPIAELTPQDDSSGVSAFFGTWPGDESEADLLDALEAIG